MSRFPGIPVAAGPWWAGPAILALAVLATPLRAAAGPPPGVAGAARDSFSIVECARLAGALAPGPRAADADARAASLDSVSAWRKPRWVASWFTDATVAPRGSYDPTFTDLGQYQLKAGIEVSILDAGSRRRTRQHAALGARSAALASAQVRRDAALRAAELAVHALELDEKAAAEDQSADWLERLASLIESGVAGGARSRTDVLRVMLARDAVATALAETRRDLDATRRELNQLLGRPPEATLRIRAPDSTEERAPESADLERLATTPDHAPEVGLAEMVQAGADVDVAEARSRTAPHAAVSVDGGLAGTDLTRAVPPDLRESNPDATFADRLRRDLGTSVSMQVSLPVRDPSLAPALKARRAAAEAAGIRRESERGTQQRIALDLAATWRDAFHRLGLARLSAARADEHLLRTKSLHAAGAISLLELLDARSLVDDARERLAEVRADGRRARAFAELRP
ncbi:MAG TPA: TolC family protein [Candidatus Eisenbacteria bacterium]